MRLFQIEISEIFLWDAQRTEILVIRILFGSSIRHLPLIIFKRNIKYSDKFQIDLMLGSESTCSRQYLNALLQTCFPIETGQAEGGA